MRVQSLVPVPQRSLCIFCAARLTQHRPFHAQSRNDQQATIPAPSKVHEQDRAANRPTPSGAASGTRAWGPNGDAWDNGSQSSWNPSSREGVQGSSLSAEERRIRQNLERENRQPSNKTPGASGQGAADVVDGDARLPSTSPVSQPNLKKKSQPWAQAGEAGGRIRHVPAGPQSFRVVMHDNVRQAPQKDVNSGGSSQWANLRRRNPAPENARHRETQMPTAGTLSSDALRKPSSQYGEYSRSFQIRRVDAGPGGFVGFEPKANLRCYQCGQLGHLKEQCPQLPQRPFLRQQTQGAADSTIASQAAPIRSALSRTPWQVDAASQAPASSDAAQARLSNAVASDTQQDRESGVRRRQDQTHDQEEESKKTAKFSRSEPPARALDDAAIRRRDDQKRKNRNILYAREAAMLREDEEERAERRRAKDLRKAQRLAAAAQTKQVAIPPFISIGHLATLLDVRTSQFERSLKRLGFTDVSHDHVLNAEDASLIAQEYDFTPILESNTQDVDLRPSPEPEDRSKLPARPPVVTIMGHVDHGKTTILDYLRKSSIAASEHGGITQHIGAFSVPMASGRPVTFLDTPGHAAFLTMRQRGANVTDIVVLVVAADDSVMPQTLESIKCAKTAGVPMIVAINKMDKPDAQPERVKQDLSRHGVELEDFGGDTQVVHVSGKTGLGMEDLEEAISTLSEILDQRADPTGVVEGWILEASTKKSGRVATILVRRGTLEVGDIIVAGTTWARVRTMRNEFGVLVESVGPGMPVEIDGWRDQPAAGDEVLEAADEQQAAAVTDYRVDLAEQVKAAKDTEAINLARRLEGERRSAEAATAEAAKADATGEAEVAPSSATVEDSKKGPQTVHFIVKGDVSGSVEAVINQVSAIGNAEIRPVILHSAVGPINQGDVERAALADGYIIAFNTTSEPGVQGQAERAGVGLIEQSIIYRVTDEVKAVMESKLPPETMTKVTGEAEVAQPFSINVEKRKFVRVAGSKVKNGTISSKSKVKVLRGGEVIYTGLVSSLRNKKQTVQDMRKGTECGIAFDGWEGFEKGDQIQCFEEVEKRRSL